MENTEIAKYRREIDSVTKKIIANPNNDDYYFHRALLYKTIGEYKLAIEDYKNMLSMNNNDVDCYFNIAELEYELGNYEEVINNCDKALSIFEEDKYYNLKCLSYRQLGQFENAIACCKQAIDVSDCAEYRYNLALLYYEIGNIESAKKEIIETQQMLYGDEDICVSLEELRNKIEFNDVTDDENNDEKMKKIFSFFADRKYKDVVYETTQLIDYFDNSINKIDANKNSDEKYKELTNELKELLIISKGQFLTVLGLANMKLGNIEIAVKNFSDAIEINKINAIAFFYRAKAFLNLCEYSKAIQDCSNVDYCINVSNYEEDEEISLHSVNELRNTILSNQNNNENKRIEIDDTNEEIINCLNKLFYNS